MQSFKTILILKDTLNNALLKGVERDFFTTYLPYFRKGTDAAENAKVFKATLEEILDDDMTGIATPDAITARRNKLLKSLFTFIEQLTVNDIHLSALEVIEAEATFSRKQDIDGLKFNIATESGQHMLKEAIKNITFDEDLEFGDLHLVNVNREEPQAKYWEIFDERQENEIPFQFYFINACPSQQPQSFAERLIYELISYYLEDDEDSILMERKKDNRVKFEDLPIGPVLPVSKKQFKKYFAKRFSLGKKSLDDFIETDIPSFEYEYISTVFTLNISKWKKSTADYLEWIINTFKQTEKDVPTFIFFFVFYMKDAHVQIDTKYQKILNELKKITQKHEDNSTLLTELLPVQVKYLEDWIRDLGEDNQTIIDEIIKFVKLGLPTEEKKKRFEEKSELDMSDIEIFQKEVYEVIMEQ